MNPTDNCQVPSLRHQPLGEQHPYEPLACERSPRQPTAGEDVRLGVETGKNPAAEAVWCTWSVDGNPTIHRSEGQLISRGESADTWQVALPAFEAYQVVRYRLYAEHAPQRAESEEFTFAVQAWEEAASVAGCELSSEQVTILLATRRTGLFLQLQADLSSNSSLTLQFTILQEGNHFAALPPLDRRIEARGAGLALAIQVDPFKLTLTRERDGLKLETAGPIRLLVDAGQHVLKYQLAWLSPTDEAFYGFGERFNALDQRGNRLDNYVYGQYTGQGRRSYIPIPFFLSSRGYGAWLNTRRQAEFDLAAAQPDRWVLTGYAEEDHARLEMQLFLQEDPKAIIQAFTDRVGKPSLPPAWVFGLWMSSNDWNSQAEVLRQVHYAQELGIPATVLVIEAWSDEINFYVWNDAQYQIKPPEQAYALGDFSFPPGGRWPNPKAMADELHRAGMHLVLWQNPTIKQAQPGEFVNDRQNKADQAYATRQGFVVTRSDGTPHRAEPHMPWFRDSLVLDFSNPQAADWWFKKREYLVAETGVDGFKTDGGEHIWDIGTHFFNGMRGSQGINDYPLAYEAAYQRFMQGQRGQDHVLFSRAGYTGVQQYSCHWAGDENSTWEAFRASLRAMLNAGMCGIAFIGWDIAGFAGPIPSSGLYLRAAAFSVFCPIMQYHSDVNRQRLPSRDRTPWNIQEQTGDERVIALFRKFTNLRMNLMPYILGQAYACSLSGLPLMTALPIEFPADPVCRNYVYQYMFGEALLVAPVVDAGVTSWPVYLPEGEWRELWAGTIYQGPCELVMEVPPGQIPVFQRKGSLVALNLDASGQLCSPVGNSTTQIERLALLVFPGEKLEAWLVQPAAVEPARISIARREQDGALVVQVPRLACDVDLVIFGHQPTSVSQQERRIPRLETGQEPGSIEGWYWEPERRETRVHITQDHTPGTVILA
jgi:alpha-D-xyloside xylohydrolase